MFGSRRIQELESRLNDVNDSVEKLTREKGELEQKLSDAVYRASEAEKDSIDAYEKISELEDTHAKLETAAAELDHQLKSEKEKTVSLSFYRSMPERHTMMVSDSILEMKGTFWLTIFLLNI